MTRRRSLPADARAGSASELDAATVDACRRGEAVALERFVRHHQHAVFALLSRMLGRGPHVEDLAQETFLRAIQALPRWRDAGPARLSTWVLTIASRLALDHQRRLRPLERLPELSTTTTPETARLGAELGAAIAEAAGRVPPDQRICFLLVDVHGRGVDEVAAMLDIPPATARTRLFRARSLLRAALAHFLPEAG